MGKEEFGATKNDLEQGLEKREYSLGVSGAVNMQ